MPPAADLDLPFPEAALRAPKGSRWRDWQIDPGSSPRVSLAALDPGAKPFSSGDKAADKAAVDSLATDIDTQRVIISQQMDAHQSIHIDTAKNRVTLGGYPPRTQSFFPGHSYRIYFDRIPGS